VTEAQAEGLRSELRLAPEDLLVVYVGGFSRNRELLPLIQAAALLPEVQVHLWGDGPQRLAVEQAVAQQPNAYYHGWLASADLPLYFKAADIIYYCLRLDYPGAVYNAPNTLTQAMAASRPIVANDVGDLGRMVRATQCGVLIDQATPQAIAEAVEQLRDPTVRAQLGANGIQAATGLYNMDVTRRQLVEIYQELFKQEPDLCIS
jgi:glycosyltransferase involved in cell wall biosynthesis